MNYDAMRAGLGRNTKGGAKKPASAAGFKPISKEKI
jgi:hypothetical protein